MAFSLGNQDKLALMMTLFGSQRRLAEALGVSHQRVGRWLREGQPATIDPETGDQLKSAGIKKIPADAGQIINDLFQIYKSIAKQQAKVDGTPYTPVLPVFLTRPLMNNGQPGLRIYAEHTQYIRPEVRINYFAALHRTEQFIQASVRSELNIFSYIGSSPKESERKRQKRYTSGPIYVRDRETGEVKFNHKVLGGSAEATIEAGGRIMPVHTKYENMSPGTATRLFINNIESKIERHGLHATKLADAWLFQLKSLPSKNETPPKKQRGIQRAKRSGRR